MKRLVSLLFLIAAFNVNAQQISIDQRDLIQPLPNYKPKPQKQKVTPTKKAIHWSEDFATGIPGTWTNTVTDVNGAVSPGAWEYRGPFTFPDLNTGGRGACSDGTPLASPTKSNGFIIFDSNYLDDTGTQCGGSQGSGSAPSAHTGVLTTSNINLSSATSVLFSMYHEYRAFVATLTIEASGNGGATWTKVWDETPFANQGDTGSTIQINLTSVLAGSSNARLRFTFDGEYYEWMIDDIVLEDGLTADMKMYDVFTNTTNQPLSEGYYTQIPNSQASADSIYFGARAIHLGNLNATSTLS
ncbi:MAG: hypothetical protein MRY83_08140, partial [Flavobacteriales bacterium]|nr:hypothetical protein [Flavobacteriales bacterium]